MVGGYYYGNGTLPDYGAIFMSSGITKQECLDKELFGLPSSQIGFVKRVRAGMILFLFEYEKRRLHGVFEAVSDGGFNLLPSAYASSGNLYPAQVRVRRIWQCDPLSEHEFRDAIRKNYFSSKKFNFGLSKRQVHKLLQLFNTRKVEVCKDWSSSKASQVGRQQNSPLDGKIEKGYSSVEESATLQSVVGEASFTPDHGRTNKSDGLWSQSVQCSGAAEDGNGSGSSPDNLGDFIPLSTHDKEDLKEGHDARCWDDDCTELPNYGFYGEGCFFEPNGSVPVLGCGSSEWISTDHEFLLMDSDKGLCLTNLELSIVDCCCEGANVDQMNNLKDKQESNSRLGDNISDTKGLYCDNTCKRSSVFSRLKLTSDQSVLDMVESGAAVSVCKIMKELRQKHKKWMNIVEEECTSETIDEENDFRRSCDTKLTKSRRQKRAYSTMASHSSGIRQGNCLPRKRHHVSAADEGTDVRRRSVFLRLGEFPNVSGDRLSKSSSKRASNRKKTKAVPSTSSAILEREGIVN